MMYLGDYLPGQTVYFMWNTNGADGASITRSTNGTISVYKDANTTQTTTGVTDSEDYDTPITGVHHCAVALTDSFYVAGSDYMVVLTAATIDTKTVNAVLAHFSILNRAASKVVYAGSVTGATTTTTLIDSGLTQASTDWWKGKIIHFYPSSSLGYQATDITAFNPATDTLTFTALTAAPAASDRYVIV